MSSEAQNKRREENGKEGRREGIEEGGRRSRNKARRWSRAVNRGRRDEQRDRKCVWLKDRELRGTVMNVCRDGENAFCFNRQYKYRANHLSVDINSSH